ncbi:amino acid adenylation domain-containing protein [Aliikangiella marina]|uniref:Amino acid adenylation domain-containing protein n=1 Tax=Aliikangiella marina TaxID=1712262 RepID=A0A545TJF1_9GAMM|nr:non-ribosomal peptide synthetase [Aliikangiella marina]TQV77359.1 amino acid adenylation domain-containing protein [Aliikangiella marina]
MTAVDVINTLVDNEIFVYLENGQLKYRAEVGRVTPEIKELVKSNKQEIINYLSEVGVEADEENQNTPRLRVYPKKHHVRLSYAQQGIWFVDKLGGGSIQFNIPGHYYINQRVNTTAFKKALEGLINRHQILKSCYCEKDGEAFQSVQDDFQLPLSLIDLSHYEIQLRDNKLEEIIANEAIIPFDLSNDLPLRVSLVKITEEENLVLYTIHHIASDGWSLEIFRSELEQLYALFSQGLENSLMPLTIQYLDYAQWQREWLQGPRLSKQLQYWQKQLSGIPQLHGIPLDKSRPNVQSFKGNVFESLLEQKTTHQILRLCQNEGVTVFMFLQTVLAILISKYSAEKDVVIGTPVSGRHHSQLEDLIGFFINSVALRNNLSDDLSVSDLLQNNKQMILDGFANQYLPFEMVVDELSPQRDLSYSPIFQIVFSVQKKDSLEQVVDTYLSSKSETPDSKSITTRVDLEVQVIYDDNYVYLNWMFNNSLFDLSTISKMSSYFNQLIQALLLIDGTSNNSLSNVKVSEISLSNKKSRRPKKIIEKNTALADKSIALMHKLFENKASEIPNVTALVGNSGEMTFKQLNNKVNQMAHWLDQKGIGVYSRVALLVNNSSELLVSILALSKVGASFVPLDIGFSIGRIDSILNDCSAEMVILNHQYRSMVKHKAKVSIDEPNIQKELSELSTTNFSVSETINFEKLPAYIIYTSGSTGQPKGVVVSHENLSNYIAHGRSYLKQNINAAVVSSPITFDATICSLLVPILHGVRVELLPLNDDLVEHLLDFIMDEDENYLFKITPAHLKLLIASGRIADDIAAKHVFVVGGESLSLKVSKEFLNYFPNACLVNEYGPTEATVGCSTFSINLNEIEALKRPTLPIGLPIKNTNLYVLDENDNIQDEGLVGELYISGSGVSLGYLDNPRLTAEKFRPDPFTQIPGSRMYQSGDLVKRLNNELLEFLKRMDSQIKLRGYRLEISDIESNLTTLEYVEDARVCLSDSKEPVLQAFIQLNGQEIGGTVYSSNSYSNLEFSRIIGKALSQKIPNYMLPSQYYFVKSIPLTSHGKVDYKKLVKIVTIDKIDQSSTPRNPEEEILYEIWSELLSHNNFGIFDNFFNVGGHSILATRLISKIRNHYNVELQLSELFNAPTIEKLVIAIKEQSTDRYCPPIVQIDRSGPLALSFAQKRLWFLDRLSEGSAHYNIPERIVLKGKFNQSAFEEGIKLLGAKHEVLRTRYISNSGEPLAVIDPEINVSLKVVNLGGLNKTTILEKLDKDLETQINVPFTLSSEHLLRVTVYTTDESWQIVQVITHHIASDGISQQIIKRDLIDHYENIKNAKKVLNKTLEIQYVDYAAWHGQWLNGIELQTQLDYWLNQLDNLPTVHSLPLDFPRPIQQQFSGGCVSAKLDGNLIHKIRSVCREQDVTLFIFMQTIFALLLSKYSNQEDIAVGIATSGRSHTSLEEVVGLFINTIIIRTNFAGDPSFIDLLKVNKGNIINAFENQNIPFEMLVEQLSPNRNLSHNPLFQIMFAVHENNSVDIDPLAAIGLVDTDKKPSTELSNSTIRTDLQVHVNDFGDSFNIMWNFNKALFKPETIVELAESYHCLVESIIDLLTLESKIDSDKSLNISQINDLSRRQRKLLLNRKGKKATIQDSKKLHELFELQTTKTPDLPAIVSDCDTLSYAELNKQSNQLARYLLQKGVSSGETVALYFENSIEMFIGMLAILKLGAAYLPIDTKLPENRINWILKDSCVNVLLSNQELISFLTLDKVKAIPLDESYRNIFLRNIEDSNDIFELDNNEARLAYVIYTSGTTGAPKGVKVSHAAVMAYLNFASESYYQEHLSGSLLLTSYHVDMSVPGMFLPLLKGDFVRLSSNISDLVSASKLLTDASKNYLVRVTPTHLSSIVQNTQIHEQQHAFVIGGESLRTDLITVLAKSFPNSSFFNHYGPTEAVVGSTISHIELPLDSDTTTISIGKPTDNTEVYILNSNYQLQIPGGIGEIAIGGESLSDGYVNNPELNNKRFIENQFTDGSNRRLYLTGDYARWLNDGNLEFIGRLDEQIKFHGFRIDSNEVEAYLDRLNGVVMSCLNLSESNSGNLYLVAYLKIDRAFSAVDELELRQLKGKYIKEARQQLAVYLPEYMIPNVFVFMDDFPVTNSGKIDKKNLPVPEQEDLQLEEYVAPISETQVKLAELWQKVLGLERVGIKDNFFSLGGHSLLATKLVNEIYESFLVDIPLKSIFEYPTVDELSNIIDSFIFQENDVDIEPVEEFVL